MAVQWPKKRRLIGTKVPRVDGPAKATGKAKYSYDFNLDGMLHAVMLRCPRARAKVKSIDTSAAEKVTGFKALHQIVKPGTELYFAGQEILAIAADTEEHARDAVRAVKIQYEELGFTVKEAEGLKAKGETASPMGKEKDRRNVRPAPGGESENFDQGVKAA